MKKKTYHSLAEAPPVYVPVEEVMKNYAAEAAHFDKVLGPDVPARLIRPRGRPRKGVTVEAGKVHTVRVPDSLWQAAKARAAELGLTANAAVQLALRDWALR